MKHRLLFAIGMALMLFVLLATACSSTPKNITITIPEDGKCSMEGPTTIPAGKDITVEVTGNVKEHDTVGIALLRLDPDKSITDLEALQFEDPQPPWTLRIGFYDIPSDGNPHSFILNQAEGPIYFLCMTPVAMKGAIGPIEVK